jgi:hypothetical protein
LDVIECYRNFVPAVKPAEIYLIPFSQFDPDCALWPITHCSDIGFEMNDAFALHHIWYQKHIIDSTSGIRAYAFLHALLKKAK